VTDVHAIFRFGDPEVGILCADLSGKGVSAALMMAHLQGLIHGRLVLPDQDDSRPSSAAFVEALNKDLHGRFGFNRFATLFYGEFNLESGCMRYVNAGHCPPIMKVPTESSIVLSDGELPVGLFASSEYHEMTVQLPSGCALLLYSDGVTETMNAEEEAYGEHRLSALLDSTTLDTDADQLVVLVLAQVSDWANNIAGEDDLTVIALRVL
jgi:serine phosphatase RsbU (regulator of sigma subunit)